MGRNRWKKTHESADGTQSKLRSGLEKKIAECLDKSKVKWEYETKTVEYVVPAETHKYKPDFILDNGIIIEAKGLFDAAARKKMSLVIEQHPDLDIRLLFQSDNTISRSSKTRYSDWCDKRGINYHVSSQGTVPPEWLKKRRTRRSAK